MMWKLVFFFAISAVTINSVWGLQCYHCDSRTNKNCESPFNATLFTAINCTDVLADACSVYTATVLNVTYTARNCATTAAGNPCTTIQSIVEATQGTLKECYSCQSDYCNSSNSLRGVLVLVAVACVFQMVFSKL